MSPREKKTILCCPSCRLLHDTEVNRCRGCGEPSPRPLPTLLERKQPWRLKRRNRTRRSLRLLDLLFVVLLVLSPFETDRRDPSWTIPVLFALLGAWALLRLGYALYTRYQWARVEQAPTLSTVERKQAEGAPDFVGVVRRLKETVEARLIGRRVLANECWLTPASNAERVRLRRSDSAAFVVEEGDELWLVEGAVRLVGPPSQSVDIAEHSSALGVELGGPWTHEAALHELQLEARDRVSLRGGKRRPVETDARLRRKRDDAKITLVQGVASNPVWVTFLKKGGPAG